MFRRGEPVPTEDGFSYPKLVGGVGFNAPGRSLSKHIREGAHEENFQIWHLFKIGNYPSLCCDIDHILSKFYALFGEYYLSKFQ